MYYYPDKCWNKWVCILRSSSMESILLPMYSLRVFATASGAILLQMVSLSVTSAMSIEMCYAILKFGAFVLITLHESEGSKFLSGLAMRPEIKIELVVFGIISKSELSPLDIVRFHISYYFRKWMIEQMFLNEPNSLF